MEKEPHTDNHNNAIVKTSIRIPKGIYEELKQLGKQHYRNLNGEIIAALETYVKDWKNRH